MSNYPEHEKLKLVKDQSQICGEFLDWLNEEKDLILAKLDEYDDLMPFHISTQKLLAEFFEIDLAVLEDEKDQMLTALRATHK